MLPSRYAFSFGWRAVGAMLGLAAALAPTPGASASAEKPLRRYTLLPQAVRLTTDGGQTETRTLVVEWLPPGGFRGKPSIEDVSFQDGAEHFAARTARVEIAGERFTGEVRLPASRGRLAGTWRFNGSLNPDEPYGTYESEQDGSARTGRSRTLAVFDTGNATAGLRVWIPPGAEPVRGIFLWSNGGDVDARHHASNGLWLGFASLHRFALAATAGLTPQNEPQGGTQLLRMLDTIAAQSGHAELRRAPIVFTGHSNGGVKAWEFNAAHPERVIAFAVVRHGLRGMTRPSARAAANPAILTMGEIDEPYRNAAIEGIFQEGRRLGAPWAMAMEKGGDHSLGAEPHLWLPFFDWAVRTRLDDNGPLRPVDRLAGWAIVQPVDKRSKPLIVPAGQIDHRTVKTSWVPNPAVAFAYLGFNEATDPFKLAVDSQRSTYLVGETAEFRVNPIVPGTWSEVQLLVNGAPVGFFTPENFSMSYRPTASGIYVATVRGRRTDTEVPVFSRPVAWVVEPN